MKKELMKKMAMPSKKAPEIEADMDLESLSLDDEPSEEELGMEGEDLLADEEMPKGNEMLADIADEELLAEVKARGLSLEDESSEADMEEDMAEGEMEDMEMAPEDEEEMA
jgi:hypothetical protein